MTAGVSAGRLFPEPPVVTFQSEAVCCPDCGGPLSVRKTRRKRVVTLAIGGMWARETVFLCPRCRRTLVADALRRLCPAKGTFGFDVLVYVGRALFQRNRSVADIRLELREKNVAVSAREVGHLGKKFIIYLSLAHRQSRFQLKAAIRQRGGYILHLDGTCEGDSPMLVAGLDELSGLVLGSVKIPTERAAALIPFLGGIRASYGVPLGLSHDMGKGILAAVAAVFPGAPDFICHFHFLRDIGAVFDELRSAMRLAQPDDSHGLNDDGSDSDIKTIERSVTAFREKVTEGPGYLANRRYVKMIGQIDKYWTKLFADPLPVMTPEGLKFIQPQRTNNIMERFFRDFKRDNRRREGTSSLAKTLRGMLAETPLVKNLASEDYVKMILDDCATLEERFAKIDSALVRQELRNSRQNAAKTSPAMKQLIRRPDFQQKMGNLFVTFAK